MSRKRDIGHDGIQEEILRKLEDSSTQRQIDIGGGVVVNITQEDYGKQFIHNPSCALLEFTVLFILLITFTMSSIKFLLYKKHICNYWSLTGFFIFFNLGCWFCKALTWRCCFQIVTITRPKLWRMLRMLTRFTKPGYVCFESMK